MNALIGADEDNDIIEGLLDIDSSGKNSTMAEPEFDSIVKQIGIQRLLHQLHCVSGCGPTKYDSKCESQVPKTPRQSCNSESVEADVTHQ